MWTHANAYLALSSPPSRSEVSACLELLERQWEPSHWGWMSDDRRPYSRDTMLGWMFDDQIDLAEFEPTARRWSRPVHKFTMKSFRKLRPSAELLLIPPTAPHELRELFALSEAFAGILSVVMGGITLNGTSDGKPVSCGPFAVSAEDVLARGVDGLYARTFFSADIWKQVNEAIEPARSRILPNGVVSVDLLDDPWLAAPVAVKRILKDSRRRLERAGLAAGKNLDRGRNWTPIAAEATKAE